MANSTSANEFLAYLDNISSVIGNVFTTKALMADFNTYVNSLVSKLNAGTLTLSEAEADISNVLTDPQLLTSPSSAVSSPVPVPNETTLIQFIYYYPPIQMNVNNIAGIASDGYTGMISIAINPNVIVSNIAQTIDVQGAELIFLTPQSFVSWYNNTPAATTASVLTTIYNYLTSPTTVASVNYENVQAYDDDYLSEQGFYTLPYSELTTFSADANYQIAPSAINPVTSYGFSSNELYLLVRNPARATVSASTIVSTSTYTSADTSTQTSLDNTANNNIANNTTSLASTVGSDIQKALPTINSDLLILGAVAIGVLGLVLYART